MSSNQYEAFADAIIQQATHEKRAQPWKNTVDMAVAPVTDEWVEVADNKTSDDEEGVDVRKQAFPMGAIDVRTHAFPMGEVTVLTNAFPM